MDSIGIELKMLLSVSLEYRSVQGESVLPPDLDAFGQVNIYFGPRVGGAPTAPFPASCICMLQLWTRSTARAAHCQETRDE
jgi:hypothetical protein